MNMYRNMGFLRQHLDEAYYQPWWLIRDLFGMMICGSKGHELNTFFQGWSKRWAEGKVA